MAYRAYYFVTPGMWRKFVRLFPLRVVNTVISSQQRSEMEGPLMSELADLRKPRSTSLVMATYSNWGGERRLQGRFGSYSG